MYRYSAQEPPALLVCKYRSSWFAFVAKRLHKYERLAGTLDRTDTAVRST